MLQKQTIMKSALLLLTIVTGLLVSPEGKFNPCEQEFLILNFNINLVNAGKKKFETTLTALKRNLEFLLEFHWQYHLPYMRIEKDKYPVLIFK